MRKHGQIIWGLVLILVVVLGCAPRVPDPGQRLIQAQKCFPPGSHMEEQIYKAGRFSILSWHGFLGHCPSKKLRVYIEGDGLAWLTPSIPSDNPTPLDPVGLKLFLRDPGTCKIYLARPGQYMPGSGPGQEYWTSHRFSIEVIRAYDKILDTIKAKYAPDSFVLFGYSGGGAVAAILAAQRSDVSRLVSVAGNLDTVKWTALHDLTPMKDSLNPADFVRELETVPQTHLIGGKDRNMDAAVFFSFKTKCTRTQNIHFKIYDQFNHECCWEKEWPTILLDLGYKL